MMRNLPITTSTRRLRKLEKRLNHLAHRCANILQSLCDTTESLRTTNNHNVNVIDDNRRQSVEAHHELIARVQRLEDIQADSIYGHGD